MAVALLATAVTTAGAQIPAGADRKTTTPAQRQANPPKPTSEEFIKHMTVAGMAEVQLGKMAAERGSNPDVKAFGQMMIKDHSKANDELAAIASQLKVQPPAQLDEKHRQLSEQLSKVQGAEFDREYMKAMVEGHEEVASQLHARTGTVGAGPVGTSGSAQGDQALDQWAMKTLPVVQQHLQRAREIRLKVDAAR